MARFTRSLLLFILSATALVAQRGDKAGEEQNPLPADVPVPPAPVRTPQEEAATFKLVPGFRAELVAADPLIGDPIAMQFGPDGRLWIVEMRGYMPNVDGIGEREPVGVIAVLTDTDRDGRYDQRTVFADRLIMPRALSLVGNGLLVAEPPHLWFFRDIDGDGKADAKTEIASDYGNITNPEHNANGLLWAMDNWIYSANFNARFKWLGDDRFARETTITRGQWGISQDDTGRIFYNSNSDPLRHDAVPAAYLKRNPAFDAAGANIQLVPGNLRIWPGRITPGVNRGYKILNDAFKITSMTAASGPVVYRGTLFPEEFHGDAFVPEPSGNLIKRIRLSETGGILSGANAYEGTEFMTSTDERFRPVNLYNGPDGALYVVDFYRGILQHRIYLTTFLRQQIEARGLDKGIAKGRIWRIVPDGTPPARFNAGLADASARELVEKLSDTSGWVRDTAQRLLVVRLKETPDAAALRALESAVLDLRKPWFARLHALWTLEGTTLKSRTVLAALDDPDGRVAAAAVRIADRFVQPGGDRELIARLPALVETRAEPEVRLQLALSLGEMKSPAGDAALRALVIAAGRQPLLADAVVSGLAGREEAFIEALANEPNAAANAADTIRFATSAVLKSNEASRIHRVLALVAADSTPEWARSAVLEGVRHSLPRAPDGDAVMGRLPAEPTPLLALAAKKDTAAARLAQELVDQFRWPGKPGAAATVKPLTPSEQAQFEKGKAQFAALCAACHQPNGQGLPGLAPSLIHSKWVLGDPRMLARIILNGKTRDNLVMPPWKAALDDDKTAAVMTFLRRSWEHYADPVSPAIVTAVRTAVNDREEPFTEAELQEIASKQKPLRRRGRK